jgi:aryl-alcohol dehydrogenase-like predicted oxidoreductase
MIKSLFTLGTAQLGMLYGVANKIGKPDARQAIKVLDEAVRQGVRSFDTAAGYGDSEKILGNYFHQNQGIESEIITKIGPLAFDSQTARNIAIQEVNKSVQESLQRLRRDSIDVLLFHRYDNLVWENYCLLDHLKKSRYIKKIGVSVYTSEQAVTALNVEGISVIQLPTNLLDMRFIRAGVFDLGEKKDIQIYIRSIYLQGLILMRIKEIPSYLKTVSPFITQLKELSGGCELSLQEFTISFLKSVQENSQIVIGCETPEQVRENARVIKSVPPMDLKLKDKIFEKMVGIPETLINPSLWKVN